MSKNKHPFNTNSLENEGWNLCIVKRGHLSLKINHTEFKPYKMYRISFDEDRKGCLVYGEWMSLKDFNANFELYIPFLHEKLKAIDMLKDCKPVTFKAFKEMIDIHDYGRGVSKLKIMYMGHPKENCFAFYPERNPNTIALKECYENYVAIINGDWRPLDNGDVVWGNSGYPLMYADIYYR